MLKRKVLLITLAVLSLILHNCCYKNSYDTEKQLIISTFAKKSAIKNKKIFVEPFPETPTNWANVFKIKVENKYYVARLLNKNLISLNDRQKEIEILQIFSKQGIVPYVHFADAYNGVIIMDYIDNKPFMSSNNKLEMLSLLAKSLKEVHTTNVNHNFNLARNKLSPIIEKVNQISSKETKFLLYKQAIKLFSDLDQLLNNDYKVKGLIHNDLNKTNILLSNHKIYLIDWDHAGLGDPFFDLATVIETFGLNSEQQYIFLKSYLNKEPTEFENSKLFLFRQLCLLRYGIVTFGLIKDVQNLPYPETLKNQLAPPFTFNVSSDDSKDLKIYKLSLSFISAALTNINSMKFSQSLSIMKNDK